MVREKHGPNRLSSYLEIHHTVMQQFLGKNFVLAEELRFEDLGAGDFLMQGKITCEGGLRIDVSKRLSRVGGTDDAPTVRTVGYSYSAVLENVGSIFRYDSPHPDHNQFHHVHRYNILDGDVHGEVHSITPATDWPTLGEVIQELCDWYFQHIDRLRHTEGQ